MLKNLSQTVVSSNHIKHVSASHLKAFQLSSSFVILSHLTQTIASVNDFPE